MEAFANAELEFQPVTLGQWPDLQKLFGPNGADSGCWCMWWRQTREQFQRLHGEPNRKSMERLLRGGEVPGILAYHEGRPVGWCSVAPRRCFPALDRSPNLKAVDDEVDDEAVWSIVCSRGAAAVEAYPIDPRHSADRPGAAFTGQLDTFLRAGFTEVARRSPRRPILRWRPE